jgi:hypothetical protein
VSTETLGRAGGAQPVVPGCLICEEAFGPERQLAFETEHLVGYVSRVYPWAVMVATQLHDVEGPWALTEAQAVDLGRIIPRVTSAMRKAGTERTYILSFGEELELPHFHVGFLARYLPISKVAHAPMYSRLEEEKVDPAQATAEYAAAIRANF